MSVKVIMPSVDSITKKILEQVKASIMDKLKGVTCPIHGIGTATIRLQKNSKGFDVVVEDICCEEYRKKIESALK